MLNNTSKKLLASLINEHPNGYSNGQQGNLEISYSNDILPTAVPNAFWYMKQLSNGMVVLVPKAHNEVVILDSNLNVLYKVPFDIGTATTMLDDDDCYYTDVVEIPNGKIIMIPRSAKYFLEIDLSTGVPTNRLQMSQSNDDRHRYYSAILHSDNQRIIIVGYKIAKVMTYDITTESLVQLYSYSNYNSSYSASAYSHDIFTQHPTYYIVGINGARYYLRINKSDLTTSDKYVSQGTRGDHIYGVNYYNESTDRVMGVKYDSANYYTVGYSASTNSYLTMNGYPSGVVGNQYSLDAFYSATYETSVEFTNSKNVSSDNKRYSYLSKVGLRTYPPENDMPLFSENGIKYSDTAYILPPKRGENPTNDIYFFQLESINSGKFQKIGTINSPSGDLRVMKSIKLQNGKVGILTGYDNKIVVVELPTPLPPTTFETSTMDVKTEKEFRMLKIPVEQADVDDINQNYVADHLFYDKAIGVLDDQMNFIKAFHFIYDQRSDYAPISYMELTREEFETMAIQSSLQGYGAIATIEYLIATPIITSDVVGAQLTVNSTENDVIWDLRYVSLMGNNPFTGGEINYENSDGEETFYYDFS